MTDFDAASRYLPRFYADAAEPFPIRRIGYTVLRDSAASPSFDRQITVRPPVEFVIEYAVYFDYDIQHLYDLEHAWIYVGGDGAVLDSEGSAHGAYFNVFRLNGGLEDGTHLPLYMQPGKHALLPRGELSQLFPGFLSACDELAGADGLLVAPMFADSIPKGSGDDERVRRYMQDKFRFTPTLRFTKVSLAEDILVPLPELLREIPARINGLMKSLSI